MVNAVNVKILFHSYANCGYLLLFWYKCSQDNRRQIYTILYKESLQMATVANTLLSTPKMTLTMLTHNR